MAPKKKYVLSTTVRWSYFDIALFRYIHTVTQKNNNDMLREALRVYATQLEDFDQEDFFEFAKREMLSEIAKGPLKEEFQAELNAFVRQPSEEDIGSFSISNKDFEEDWV